MGVLILGLIQTLIIFQGTKITIGVLLLLFIILQKSIAITRRESRRPSQTQ